MKNRCISPLSPVFTVLGYKCLWVCRWSDLKAKVVGQSLQLCSSDWLKSEVGKTSCNFSVVWRRCALFPSAFAVIGWLSELVMLKWSVLPRVRTFLCTVGLRISAYRWLSSSREVHTGVLISSILQCPFHLPDLSRFLFSSGFQCKCPCLGLLFLSLLTYALIKASCRMTHELLT